MIEIETIPCEICGQPTQYLSTKRCNNCYEVEARLSTYLRSPKGVEHVRSLMPRLDDWVDGKPDAWDYEAVLASREATVEQFAPMNHGYILSWPHGSMYIATGNKAHAKKAAALFIELWLRGVSASFADKLMDGFLFYLKVQEKSENSIQYSEKATRF